MNASMSEQELRRSMRQYISAGKPVEALVEYRSFISRSNGAAVTHETLEIVESALDMLQRQNAVSTVGDRNQTRVIGFRTLPYLSVCIGLLAFGLYFGRVTSNPTMLPVAVPEKRAAASLSLSDCMGNGDRLYQAGMYSEALKWDERAYANSLNANSVGDAATALCFMGRDRQALGSLQLAHKLYLQALDFRLKTGPSISIAYVEEMLGGIETLLGNARDAEKHLQDSLKRRSTERDMPGIVECETDLGDLSAQQKGSADALQHFAKAISIARANSKPEMIAAIEARIGSLACATGDTKTARRLLLKSLDFWQQRGHARWIAGIEMRLSTVALTEGNTREAAERAEHSLALYRSVGDRCNEAQSSVVRAQAYLRSGDVASARPLLQGALVYAEASGLAPLATRVRALLTEPSSRSTR